MQSHGVSELALPRKIFHTETIPVLGTGKTDLGAVQKIAEDHLTASPLEKVEVPEPVTDAKERSKDDTSDEAASTPLEESAQDESADVVTPGAADDKSEPQETAKTGSTPDGVAMDQRKQQAG